MSEEVASSAPEGQVADSTATPEAASQETVVAQESEGSESIGGIEAEATGETNSAGEQLFTIKIDGVEAQVTRDELLRGYQTAKAAHKRFQEAANLKEQFERHMNRFTENPIQAAIELAEKKGITAEQFRQATEQWLWEHIQREQMSPEERERLELKEKVKQYEEQQKKLKEEEEKSNIQREVAKARDKYAAEMSQAIKTHGLEADPRAVQQVAQILLNSVDERGVPTLSVNDAVAYYKEEQTSAISKFLGGVDMEKLTALLGNDKLNQLRKQDIAKLKNPTSSKTGKPEVEKILEAGQSEKRKASDFFSNLKV